MAGGKKVRYFVSCPKHGHEVGGTFRGVNNHKEVVCGGATSRKRSRDIGCPICNKETPV